MGAINSNVMGALRGWLTTEAKALLETMPEEERGTSVRAKLSVSSVWLH